MIPLEGLTDFKNENILKRFLDYFSFTHQEAEEIFEETKKWLWLCAKIQKDRTNYHHSDLPVSLVLDEQTQVIDEMWHCFILFTNEYQKFCTNFLGVFIHHYPNSSNQEEIDFDALYEKQFNYIYDNLGEETLKKWYEEFPVKYSMQKLSLNYKYLKDV